MAKCRHDGSWQMEQSHNVTLKSLRTSYLRLWRVLKPPCQPLLLAPYCYCAWCTLLALFCLLLSSPAPMLIIGAGFTAVGFPPLFISYPVCWIADSCARLFGSEKLYLIMRASIKKSISSCSEQISGRVCGAQWITETVWGAQPRG